MNASKIRTGSNTVYAAALVLVAGWLGLPIPEPVALAIVALTAAITSAVAPRWAEARGLVLDAHPAGLTATIVTVLVFFAPLIGKLLGTEISLTVDQATILVTVATLAVSAATPRDLGSEDFPTVYGDNLSASHDEVTEDIDRERVGLWPMRGEFAEAVEAKVENVGAQVATGDHADGWTKTPADICAEMADECVDVAGWGRGLDQHPMTAKQQGLLDVIVSDAALLHEAIGRLRETYQH